MKHHITILALILLTSSCTKSQDESKTQPNPQAQAAVEQKAKIDRSKYSLFKPLPKNFFKDGEPSPELLLLGQQLYHDTRLSANNDISCNTCHLLDKFGVDGKVVSVGHKGQKGERNSPTVFNAAGHFVQFWDGRAADVEEQAFLPILNPIEMAMKDEASVVKKLKAIPGYVEAFRKAFPTESEPLNHKNISVAIGAFERQLVTPSRWDAFLAGKDEAITAEELRGADKFLEHGCQACHSGALLGANMYQKVGSVEPWPNQKDTGRFQVTGNEVDKFLFKASSLRNVTQTAPYFHDGSVADLGDAIKAMGKHQLGKEISDDDTNAIIAWFKTLEASIPEELQKAPALP